MIAIADVMSQERVQSDKVIAFFGMQYTVPVVENLSGTVIAINVGGSGNSDAIVAVVLHWLANPVPGVGIAVPVFIPATVTTATRMEKKPGARRQVMKLADVPLLLLLPIVGDINLGAERLP